MAQARPHCTGRRIAGLLVAAVAVASIMVGAPAARGAATCAGPADGGDWPLNGNTPDNARHQTAEARLGPETVGSVTTAWKFRPGDHGMGGVFSSTPIVLEGCIYVATSLGHVIALNADTGEVVWQTDPLPGNAVLTSANVISSAPTIVGDTVYVSVTRSGSPYIAALDRASGVVRWTSVIEDAQPGAFSVPSPVHHDGVLFQGFSVYFDGETEERGGYAIVDATTGQRLVHRYVIDDEDYAAGYGGAGVWCTGAVDVDTDHVFACTSNPASPREHRLSNSLIKVDLDRGRGTFGDIVAAYKGTPDNYVPGAERQPACDQLPNLTDPYYSATCLQFDLDFGASPTLFQNSRGDAMVGSLQKSGVFHAAYRDNLQAAWTTVVGTPCSFWCNGSSPANDGSQLYTVGSPGGTMWALGADQGHQRWASPVGHTFHYHPTSLANGVAYTVNGFGTLVGIDTATGLPVLEQSMAVEGEQTPLDADLYAWSSGVAIARSTIYAAFNEWLVAYR